MADYSPPRRWRRTPVTVECRIEGVSGRASVRVTDLSFGGGHVETPAIFIPGDPVSVVMILDGEEVTVSGTVVYTHAGLGFGFEFDLAASPASSRERIARFLKGRGIDTPEGSSAG